MREETLLWSFEADDLNVEIDSLGIFSPLCIGIDNGKSLNHPEGINLCIELDAEAEMHLFNVLLERRDARTQGILAEDGIDPKSCQAENLLALGPDIP